MAYICSSTQAPIPEETSTSRRRSIARPHAPLSDPTLVGLRVDHAFTAYSLGPLTVRHISNPVRVTLVQ